MLNPDTTFIPGSTGAEIGYDPSLGFGQDLLREAHDLWQSLGGAGKLPSLGNIDPLELPNQMLPHVQLLDIEPGPAPRYRWRLIGTHITHALGRDSTGRYWDELYQPEVLEALSRGIDWVRERRRPIRCFGSSSFAEKEFQRFEAIEMPLSDDQETVNAVWIVAVYG